MTIDGTGQTVILSGNDQYQIISTNPGGVLTLQLLTLTDSSVAFDGNLFENRGTAIQERPLHRRPLDSQRRRHQQHGADLTVINSTFSANQAAGDAGAIYTGMGGVAYITNVTFSGNTAAAGDGGALYNHSGTVDLKGSILDPSTGRQL